MPRYIPPVPVAVVHGPHALLDGAHLNDTAAAAVVVGDLIRGNAVPAWSRLGIGAAGDVLTVVAGLPAWAAPGAGALTLLGSHTLGVAGTPLTVSWAGAYTRLLVLCYIASFAANDCPHMHFNNDNANNYASQRWGMSGTGANINDHGCPFETWGWGYVQDGTSARYLHMTIENIATHEKLTVGQYTNKGAAGAGTAPKGLVFFSHKWTNVVNAITRIDVFGENATNMGAGSYLYVYALS